MGGMRRAGVSIAVLVGLTALGGASGRAGAATPPAAALDRAVVTVATPDLPTPDSSSARTRWHQRRAQSREALDRLVERNDLRVESMNPDVGILSIDLGNGGLEALRHRLRDDPRVL